MRTNRRAFVRLAAAGGMGSLLSLAVGQDGGRAGITIGCSLNPALSDADLEVFRNTGVETASVWTTIDNNNYEFMIRTRRRLESNGIRLLNIGILDLHCDPTIVLGLPGQDRKIQQYKEYLGNLGRAGIHYTTYAHMANIKVPTVPGYYQTSRSTLPNGVPTREFDLSVARNLPLSNGREYSEDEIWKTFTEFITAVMPVAEKEGVRIGLHPDDPPVPSLGGVARVFRNFEGYERALRIANSDNFGLCFCVGTWAEGGSHTGKDVFEMIRYFGSRKKIFKVHFRNVSSPLPRFRETFLDNGYLDMYRVMRTLREVNYDSVVIPDHVPGETGRGINTSYLIGYMKALRDRANAEFGRA